MGRGEEQGSESQAIGLTGGEDGTGVGEERHQHRKRENRRQREHGASPPPPPRVAPPRCFVASPRAL